MKKVVNCKYDKEGKAMLNIAICDDERSTVENVERCVLDFGTKHGFNIKTFKFYDGESLVSSDIKFDIIFLDGQMKGIDGIETASLIRENDMDIAIVFITSFAYYSTPAHTVHSFDFITKPFTYEDFERVLNDYLRTSKKSKMTILDIYDEQGQLIMQNVDDIICFKKERDWRRKIIMCTVKKDVCINGTISEMFSKLDGRQFFVPHVSFIINLRHVITLNGLYEILMTNDHKIPLSQKRKEEFKDKLHKFAIN